MEKKLSQLLQSGIVMTLKDANQGIHCKISYEHGEYVITVQRKHSFEAYEFKSLEEAISFISI
jgi:hypothetical protein